MTAFTALKLTATKKPTQVPQILQRRLKLSKRLWEQIELAKAQQNGTTFSVAKFRSYTDKESGIRKQIETNKRLKAWWFVGDNGKIAIAVRYGTSVDAEAENYAAMCALGVWHMQPRITTF